MCCRNLFYILCFLLSSSTENSVFVRLEPKPNHLITERLINAQLLLKFFGNDQFFVLLEPNLTDESNRHRTKEPNVHPYLLPYPTPVANKSTPRHPTSFPFPLSILVPSDTIYISNVDENLCQNSSLASLTVCWAIENGLTMIGCMVSKTCK